MQLKAPSRTTTKKQNREQSWVPSSYGNEPNVADQVFFLARGSCEMEQPILVIAAFVRNVQIRRALQTVEPTPSLNFWRVLYGNCTDMAVIDWCKLFGSDRDSVHWKRVVPKSEHTNFRRDLLAYLHVPRKAWRTYREGMKNYRDKLAAHHDPFRPSTPRQIPMFDLGVTATVFYYDWILKGLNGTHTYPLDLEEYCRRISKQAVRAAELALTATAAVESTVI